MAGIDECLPFFIKSLSTRGKEVKEKMVRLIGEVEMARGEAEIEGKSWREELFNFQRLMLRYEAVFYYGVVEGNKILCDDKTVCGRADIFAIGVE